MIVKKLRFILLLIQTAIFFSCFFLYAQDKEKEFKIPPVVKFLRIYGGQDERKPPVVVIRTSSNTGETATPFGEPFVTVEFDVEAPVPPNLYAKFVHCTADWSEEDNIFLNDITLRTSNIFWTSAPISSYYYTHRGTLTIPNEQVKFKFSGNWKIKLYEVYEDTTVLAEGRFFVVDPKVNCTISLTTDFYTPEFNVSPSALTFEALVSSNQNLMDNFVNTAVLYRNNRWFEPYFISMNTSYDRNNLNYKYKYATMIAGFIRTGKIFRIAGVPAQNMYRLLDMTNPAQFPNINAPIRLPLSDYRRNGTYLFDDNDGAMITSFIPSSQDEYLNIEFVMDPDRWVSKEDVFITGSFNNWNPDYSWQMYYDPDDRYYHLRHWVRRAQHDYLYATGRYDEEKKKFVKLAYDEYEGNSAINAHTYIIFVYYHDINYGGYDALVGLGAVNIYGSVIR